MNPAVTLCFLRLGKIEPIDAAFYVLAQFIGGAAGVAICRFAAGSFITHPSVNHVVTIPGPYGVATAWLAEFAISFLLMATILGLNRYPSLAKRTGFFAGGLVAIYITFEAPVSGMSINPARTLGSAVVAHLFTGIWIYFTAPIAGMLLAVELHRFFAGHKRICGKLSHCHKTPCIFRCNCLDAPGIEPVDRPTRESEFT
jgi:aquaporin Z